VSHFQFHHLGTANLWRSGGKVGTSSHNQIYLRYVTIHQELYRK